MMQNDSQSPEGFQHGTRFRWILAFTMVWLCLGSSGLFYGLWKRVETGYVGLTAAQYIDGQGWKILEVHSGSPASKAGVRPDWILVSVGGRKLGPKSLIDSPEAILNRETAFRWKESQEWLREALKPGNIVSLKFLADPMLCPDDKEVSGSLERSKVSNEPETGLTTDTLEKNVVAAEIPAERTPAWLVFRRSAPFFLVGIAFLIMGLTLVRRKPESRPALLLLVFCLFHQTFLFTQPLTEFPRTLAIPRAACSFFVEASDFFIMMSAAAIFHFVLAFSGVWKKSRGLAAGFVYITAAGMWVLHFFRIGAPYTLGFVPLVYGVALVFLMWAYRMFRKFPEKRKQVKWLLWGGAVPVAGLLLVWYLNFLADTQIRRSDTSLLLAISTLAFPGATVVAVLQHRLFDIDIIVRRSVLAAVVLPLLALGYFLTMRSVGSAFGFSEPPLAMLMIVLFFVLFLPGQVGLEDRLDRFLGRRRYNARLSLQNLAGSLVEEDGTDIAAKRVAQGVREAMELRGCAVLLSDLEEKTIEPHVSGDWLSPPEAMDFAFLEKFPNRCEVLFAWEFFKGSVPAELGKPEPVVLIPLATGSRKWGLLLLGPRLGNRDWYRRDLESLTLPARTLAMTVDRIHHKKLLDKVHAMQAQVIHTGRLAALGTLAAGVAHELNTPLGYVKSNAQVLAQHLSNKGDDRVSTDFVELARDISEGVDQMNAVVSNLRIFSQVDSRGDVNVDLNDSIRRSLAMMENSRPAGVEIEMDLVEIPRVKGFPAQLNQMVVNIVTNAWDAVAGVKGVCNERCEKAGTRKKTEGKVFLSSGVCKNGENVFFRVVDNGPGIPEEIAEKLFDPFFTTKNVGQGMGLGLSITRTIVESHGGTIDASNRKDGHRGAEVIVTLPVTKNGKHVQHE